MGRTHMNAIILLFPSLLLLTSAIAHATSWRYNAGFLQGVSGVQLKGTHTQGVYGWIYQRD
jgi:hypothetical protein